MPESECQWCHEKLTAPTDDDLKKLELKHHIDSIIPIANGFTHKCGSFSVYNEGGVHYICTRTYAHGKYSSNI